MPCSSSDGDYRNSGLSERAIRQIVRSEMDSNIVPMLCAACKELESAGYDFKQNPKLGDWWTAHKLWDEGRERREKERRNRKD